MSSSEYKSVARTDSHSKANVVKVQFFFGLSSCYSQSISLTVDEWLACLILPTVGVEKISGMSLAFINTLGMDATVRIMSLKDLIRRN